MTDTLREGLRVTKPKAHYRAGAPHRKCEFCTMFRPPHGCTAVSGEVSKDGLCDFFKRLNGKKSDWYGGNKEK